MSEPEALRGAQDPRVRRRRGRAGGDALLRRPGRDGGARRVGAAPGLPAHCSTPPGDPHGLDGGPMFVLLNPNKLSRAPSNLSKPEGVARGASGWCAGPTSCPRTSRRGAMAKWGLDYERLRELKPDLVMVSSCLFGQTGPQRMYPGFGGQGSAIAGFNHLAGWPDREALGPCGTITDSLSPRYVALLIAAALLPPRSAPARAQYIDVSQIETGVYSLSEAIVRASAQRRGDGAPGNRAEDAAPHAIYPCAGEDRWIAIAVSRDAEWRRCAQALGAPELARDPRFASAADRLAHEDALDARARRADARPRALRADASAPGGRHGGRRGADLRGSPGGSAARAPRTLRAAPRIGTSASSPSSTTGSGSRRARAGSRRRARTSASTTARVLGESSATARPRSRVARRGVVA